MTDSFSRTRALLGAEAMERLAAAKVAVFGIGGVGSYVAEGLARSGVGAFILVDDDRVCRTNINRQVIALESTIGKPKVEVMKARILDINPRADVEALREYADAASAPRILGRDLPGGKGVSYVVDAIDTVTSKIALAMLCAEMRIPVVSSMGAGNKLDPTKLELADIYATSGCPLARVMRNELRKRGLASLDVVYSRETPMKVDVSPAPGEADRAAPGGASGGGPEGAAGSNPEGAAGGGPEGAIVRRRRGVPGSVAFVPSVAGLIIASHVVRRLAGLG